MRRLLYILPFILVLLSCKKDKIGPQCLDCNENQLSNTSSSDILIINEGNFGFGNGSVSIYNDSNLQISQNVFQQNNGIPLGDVAQSAYQFNNKIYIVVNNSNKIEVVNSNNLSSITTINGFISPRYFLPIDSNKAYVTDLFANAIQIVDLNSNTITGNINVNGWTEQLLLYQDTVYVCDMTNNNLLLFSTQTDQFIDSVKVGIQPNSIVIDKNNRIWILCDGGMNESLPQLIRFNPQNRQVEASFQFPSLTDSPSELKINSLRDELYFINSSIYKMNINDSSLPTNSLVSNNGRILYGLGVNQKNDQFYIADAIDFVQNSSVFRYSKNGVLLDSFKSGIITGEFLFLN